MQIKNDAVAKIANFSRSQKNEVTLLYYLFLMMKCPNKLVFLILFLAFWSEILAQDWETAKEKDGISIFTRHMPGSNYKSFRGEVEFKADYLEVSDLIEDVENFEIWDESITELRVLESEKGKSIRYYVIYNSPWPVTDRDLGIQATISDDPETGGRQITAISAPEAVPPDPDMVRIVDYWQKWSITPIGNGLVHLTVEGFADPAGDIPAWLANMAITDTPLNMLHEIRKSTQK